MLRALLIRQAFLLLDLILVGIVALIAFSVVTTYLGTSGRTFTAGVGEVDTQDIVLATLDTRDAYGMIENSGLFGEAARSRQDEAPPPPPPPPPPADDEVSELPLRLWGTVSLENPESRLATAVIERTGGGSQGRSVYFVGDVIADGVVVREVHYKRVRLFNPNLNRHEWLVRDETTGQTGPTVRRAASPPRPAARQVTGPSVSVNTQELAQRMQTEGVEIYAQMAPSIRVATDEAGEPLGLTADGIGDVPLARELGFQEGDILREINGRPVQNPNELMGLLTQFQGVDTFRVSVLRDGSPQMLTISLR
jgi:type II secretory pathway component PulC